MNVLLYRQRSLCNLKFFQLNFFSRLYIVIHNGSHRRYCFTQRKRVQVRGCIHVKNPEVANIIASYIIKEGNEGYLLEANPGSGVLSKALLQNGVKLLRAFEMNKEFLPNLQSLASDYPSFEIIKDDLMMIPTLEYKKSFTSYDNSAGEYFDNIFRNIPVNSWENEPAFQILSVTVNKTSLKFLRYLLPALPNQATLFSKGRCNFFFLISEMEFMSMNALPNENFTLYRWSTVLYNLFYDIKFLHKFPADSKNFSIPRSERNTKNSSFYLIKMTPKPDIFSEPMSPEKLLEFFYFVRSNLAKRTDLVIKSIEKWMPFSGPRLIKEGLNIFVRFGDLSPAEILRLFIVVSSWSEYKGCYSEALACKFNRKKLEEEESSIE